MNDSDSTDFDSMLDERAAEWLFEREEGFKPGRAEAFAQWRDQDTRHAEALSRVERTLSLLEDLPEVRIPLESRVAALKRKSAVDSFPTRRKPRLAWTVGMAAAIALGFIIWQVIVIRKPAVEHYTTDVTAQRSMMLPDGSVLDLNTVTDVVVQFTARERRILLERGEAHIQVAHDAARPLTVVVGGISVRAVGTAFNVRRAGKGIDVLVVEGKVEVSQNELSAGKPFGEAAPLLVAGERVQLANVDEAFAPRIETIDDAKIQSLLAWQNPLTNFDDVPLRDVVARFNRRNATQLILADADLGDRRIGGMIALDQVDAFVRLLEQDGDIVADRAVAAGITLRHAR